MFYFCGPCKNRGLPLSSYKYSFNVSQYRKFSRLIKRQLPDDLCPITVYEIGSRDAADAFFLATLTSKEMVVHCFDPHPAFLDLGRGFASMSSAIRLHNYAVHTKRGVIDFYCTDTDSTRELCDDWGIGASSLKVPVSDLKGLPTNGYKKVTVESRTGEDLCAELGQPNVLILDVQGAELDVLTSFDRCIDDVQLIFCEVNVKRNIVYSDDASASDVVGYLRGKGFRLSSVYNVSTYSADLTFSRSGGETSHLINRTLLIVAPRMIWLIVRIRDFLIHGYR